MNQFTSRKKLAERERERNRPQSKPWVFSLLGKFLLIPVAAFAAAVLRISYADKAEKLEQQAVSIRAEINFLDKEIQNLKGKREELYSLRHIESKIREYRLGLRQTKNEQLCYLKRYHFAPVAANGEYAVAANENGNSAAAKKQMTASLR
ncbi:MAG: hypothetical protein IKB16_13930 [Lentisphaeria bacterium]|nr:hypothetical protein [Lentisphaeria bacterium]